MPRRLPKRSPPVTPQRLQPSVGINREDANHRSLPCRVLLSDPSPVARTGLMAVLAQDPRFAVVGEVAEDIVTAARELDPDIVLIDPAASGRLNVELIGELSDALPTPKICLYTSLFEPDQYLAAMSHGADTYLIKGTEDDEQLLPTLDFVIRSGAVVTSRTVADYFAAHPERKPIIYSPEMPAESPTRRESDVLPLVVSGLTDQEIGMRLGIKDRTVEAHVYSLMAKFRARTRAHLAVLAVRAGVSLSGPAPPREHVPR